MIDVKAIIKAFCERLGVKSEAEADGVFSFSVDSVEFAIHDFSEDGIVVLMGELGSVPMGNIDGLYRLMLEAQHTLSETGGSTFSIDSQRDLFMLSRTMAAATLDEDILFSEVERFVNHLEIWTNIIRNYEGQKETHEPSLDVYGIKV